MTTRRITAPTNPDGSPMTYPQRKAARLRADRQRRMDDRAAKQQAAQDAAANPPPPALSFKQRQEQRKAEDYGRQQAAEKQAAEAAANAPPVNSFRERANECAARLYQPGMKARFEHFTRLADAEDARRAEQQAAAERQAAIDADPAVKLARDYAAGLVKLAPPEFQTEAAECDGIAKAGDAALAWQRMKALDEKIWRAADQKAAEARAAKAVNDAAFTELATAAEQARERADQSAAIVESST